MTDIDDTPTGLEVLLAEPEIVAWLGERRRPDPDEAEDGDEPPRAA
ncbi:MAG TPA: hypothetical protein VLW49_04950 [Gaiellaceae bacterium]|nr:hypothetical protein [Gaiellaceae bacterium]